MRNFLWILALASVFTSPVGGELIASKSVPPILFNPSDAERIILVGFMDRHIERIHSGTPNYAYRRRGPYQSSTWSQRIAKQIEKDYALHALSDWPITEVGMHCVVYLVPKTMSVDEVLQDMAGDDRLNLAQRMHVFHMKGHQPYSDPYYSLQSNLSSMHLEDLHARTTGRNITIALVDTGVDLEHPDLAGQVMANGNFAVGFSSGFSEDVHGTAVAGVIAARSNNGTGIVGIAPDSKLIALKACWPNQAGSLGAVCNSFTVALAVNSAIKLGVKILNMSLTGPKDPLVEALLAKAIANGMIVVAADPDEAGSETGFPASMDQVIAVRSLPSQDQQILSMDDDRLLAAPGLEILTTLPNGAYDFISGSSLAAAHVSAVVALLLQLQPDLSGYQVLHLFENIGGPDLYRMLREDQDLGRLMQPGGMANAVGVADWEVALK